MSFIIAILPPDQRDLVFCSEGKELALIRGYTEINEETTFPVRDNHMKTLALNPKLCIGLMGRVDSNRHFLEELLPALPWKKCAPRDPPMNFADAITVERGVPLLDIGVTECCQRITSILSALGLGKDVLPIIGGEEAGVIALHYIKYRDTKYEILSTELAYGDAPGFIPSDEFSSTDEIVHRVITLASLSKYSIESLWLRVVDIVADHSITCNKNVTLRRLSRGFIKEGREDFSR